MPVIRAILKVVLTTGLVVSCYLPQIIALYFQDLPTVPSVNYAEFYHQFMTKMQTNVALQNDLLKAFQLQAGAFYSRIKSLKSPTRFTCFRNVHFWVVHLHRFLGFSDFFLIFHLRLVLDQFQISLRTGLETELSFLWL